MILPEKNKSLKLFNTFGIDANARFFMRFSSINELREIYADPQFQAEKKIIIGGGSNILFQSDFEGVVLKNEIRSITKLREDDDHVWIYAGAGEVWHELVLHCIENNWAGIENLSLIPGCVGAAPMQNIGAYGVEVKNVIDSVLTVHLGTLEERTFTNAECQFGYRESVFKNELKDQFCITGVVLKLNKKPVFHVTYGAIQDELNKYPNEPLSIRKISNAVIRIRQSKLPDPAQIGNAGSFFKNPEVPFDFALELKSRFPDIVTFPVNPGTVKIAAGWLIEQCGWKGFTRDNYGVHKMQALVLVNYGGAEGQKIVQLSDEIIRSVSKKFGVSLVREVNLI